MPHVPCRKRQQWQDDQHRVWPGEIQQRDQSEERCQAAVGGNAVCRNSATKAATSRLKSGFSRPDVEKSTNASENSRRMTAASACMGDTARVTASQNATIE